MDQKFYNNYSLLELRHWWFIGRKKILTHLLSQIIKDKITFLDVGCGSGLWMKEWENKISIFGIDKYYKFLKECKSNKLEKVSCGLMQMLPFKSNSFSCISLLDVLEHVDDESSVLEEVKRVARPDAIVFFTVPAFSFLWGNQDIVSHHRRRYTVRNIKSLMLKHGFYIVKISYFNTLLFPIVFIIRMFRLIRIKSKKSEHIKSDFEINRNPYINTMLSRIFSLERYVLSFVSMPVGVSIVCAARVVK